MNYKTDACCQEITIVCVTLQGECGPQNKLWNPITKYKHNFVHFPPNSLPMLMHSSAISTFVNYIPVLIILPSEKCCSMKIMISKVNSTASLLYNDYSKIHNHSNVGQYLEHNYFQLKTATTQRNLWGLLVEVVVF